MNNVLEAQSMKALVGQRVIGCASSSVLGVQRAFSALSFTLNASGSNCTWSIEARTIGLERSLTLALGIALVAARETLVSTSRKGR